MLGLLRRPNLRTRPKKVLAKLGLSSPNEDLTLASRLLTLLHE